MSLILSQKAFVQLGGERSLADVETDFTAVDVKSGGNSISPGR